MASVHLFCWQYTRKYGTSVAIRNDPYWMPADFFSGWSSVPIFNRERHETREKTCTEILQSKQFNLNNEGHDATSV